MRHFRRKRFHTFGDQHIWRIKKIRINASRDWYRVWFACNFGVFPQCRFSGWVFGEADDHTVHGCFAWCFGVPCEGAVRKLYVPPFPIQRSEQCRDGLRSEEHTSELQSRGQLVCRLLLEKKKNKLHLS